MESLQASCYIICTRGEEEYIFACVCGVEKGQRGGGISSFLKGRALYLVVHA